MTNFIFAVIVKAPNFIVANSENDKLYMDSNSENVKFYTVVIVKMQKKHIYAAIVKIIEMLHPKCQ